MRFECLHMVWCGVEELRLLPWKQHRSGLLKERKCYTQYLLRMASSGMLRRVALGISSQLASVASYGYVPRSPIVTLIMDAPSSSVTSVLTRATRRNITEDAILHSHRRVSLKSYTIFVAIFLPAKHHFQQVKLLRRQVSVYVPS
jgi:hypothetical protein